MLTLYGIGIFYQEDQRCKGNSETVHQEEKGNEIQYGLPYRRRNRRLEYALIHDYKYGHLIDELAEALWNQKCCRNLDYGGFPLIIGFLKLFP